MNKLLLTIALAFVSTFAMAEWTLAGGENDSTSYVDLPTIYKNGDMPTIWVLEDLNTAKCDSKDKYLSTNEQNEYDCKE